MPLGGLLRRSSNAATEPNVQKAQHQDSGSGHSEKDDDHNTSVNVEHSKLQTGDLERSRKSSPLAPVRTRSTRSVSSTSSRASARRNHSPSGIRIDEAPLQHGLARRDVRTLFYGAPHFMLEKGRHRHFYPQVIYPWNDELEIADLWDRRRLRHEAFSLSTLHAHLPVPDEQALKHHSTRPLAREPHWKGASFEVGVFEVPNMLSFEGAAPGTVGMRYFLELPAADELNDNKETSPEGLGQHDASKDISRRSLTDIMKAATQDGKYGTRIDRLEMVRSGPKSWRRLGLREISMQSIIARLTDLSRFHDQLVLLNDHRRSILEFNSISTLYDELFTKFVYPPVTEISGDGVDSLKFQVATLLRILATADAWFDLSHADHRINIGYVFWQAPVRQETGPTMEEIEYGPERKWLLIQFLLAVELLVRMDALIKFGMATHSEEVSISEEDLHQFNHLRNRKTDWDLVFARRFMDFFKFSSAKSASSHARRQSSATPSEQNYFRSRLSRTFSGNGRIKSTESPWDLVLIPRRANVQVEGLIRFAQYISWPHVDEIERTLNEKLGRDAENIMTLLGHNVQATRDGSFNSAPSSPVTSPPLNPVSSPPSPSSPLSGFMFPRTRSKTRDQITWTSRSKIVLRQAGPTDLGSWMSKSWLTGTVLPGPAISHFLIATLLENDTSGALKKLGDEASLLGGFVLDGHSWWSKYCIVSRVLAPLDGTAERTGWTSLGTVVPTTEHGHRYTDGWIDIVVDRAPSVRDLGSARLFDGQRMARESSTLGIGQGKITSLEFKIPTETTGGESHDSIHATFGALHVQKHSHIISPAHSASVEFSMQKGSSSPEVIQTKRFRLRYDVYFICAQPCRLPYGHCAVASDHEHLIPEPGETLPAHPLHKSYRYRVVHLEDLASHAGTGRFFEGGHRVVTVVDARGHRDNDALTRAWCAETGRHALIAKEGRVCISCCVREARALDIDTVIRVGHVHVPSK